MPSKSAARSKKRTAAKTLSTLGSSGKAGKPTVSDAAQIAGQAGGATTVEKGDIEAIDWLLGGMIHCLGTCDPQRTKAIAAEWRGKVADIHHAYEIKDRQLPQMVQQFMHDTAEHWMRGIRAGRPVYWLLGFHGAQLFDGDKFGYFEFDSPPLATAKLIEILKLSKKCGVPVNLEFGLSSLQILCRRYPELEQALNEAIQSGRAEMVNSTYSLPYGQLISAESNLRQFEYGRQVFEEMFGRNPDVYVSSEFSAFPQMPQIIEYFGISSVSLRGRFGIGPSALYPVVIWEGLDGTQVRALVQQTNTFSGEYFGWRFYQEFFALLLQACSGVPREYAVYANLDDHILSIAKDDAEKAMRVNRYGDILGHYCTYSELFANGPAPYGVYSFACDQFGFHRVPEARYRQKGLGHKQQLTTVESERRLLQAEGLVARAQLAGANVDGLADELRPIWGNLMLGQSHDCLECPSSPSGEYSHERLSMFPKEDQHYVTAIPDRGLPTIANRALMLLEPVPARIAAIESKAMESMGLKKSRDTKQVVRFNPQSFTVDGLAPGLSIGRRSTTSSSSWKWLLEDGRLVIKRQTGLCLKICVTDDKGIFSPLRKQQSNGQRFVADIGMNVQIEPVSKGFILHCESTVDGLKVCFSGFKPGSEVWCNYPMGAELTRIRDITTTDFVWVRGSFIILSDANHYYTADLEHTELSDYLWDQGRYDLMIVPDDGMNIADAGRELAEFAVPPVEYAVTAGSRPLLNGPAIESDTIYMQALIPGKDKVLLRAMNYSNRAAAANIHLPEGWRLGAQVDAYGKPYREQPQGDMIRLGPWGFGTFEIVPKQ